MSLEKGENMVDKSQAVAVFSLFVKQLNNTSVPTTV